MRKVIFLIGFFVVSGTMTARSLKTSLEIPLAKIPITRTNMVDLTLGVGSGAFHHPDDPVGLIYSVTDRGPNFDCSSFEDQFGVGVCGGGDGKVFPLPNFIPMIVTLKVDTGASDIEVDVVDLQPLFGRNGKPLTGLPSKVNGQVTEAGFDLRGNIILDPGGVDTEAIIKTSNGMFWLADEYAPSLLRVSKDGTVIMRLVPQGLENSFQGAPYDVFGALPEILKRRRLNRGIEGLALTPNEEFMYFAMQSPLANPDVSRVGQSQMVRIFKISLDANGEFDQIVGEFVYPLDAPNSFANKIENTGDLKDGEFRKQSDVKVSEILAIDTNRLLVLERISKVTKVYSVIIGESQSIFDTKYDDVDYRPCLETRSLQTVPILAKVLVWNSLTDSKSGEFPKKLESMVRIKGKQFLFINDNDFGIDGEKTELVTTKIPLIE